MMENMMTMETTAARAGRAASRMMTAMLLQSLVNGDARAERLVAVLLPVTVAVVALTAGLALLTFVKAYGIAFLANWAQLYITTRVGQDVLRTIRTEIFEHLQMLPLTYFDRHYIDISGAPEQPA